MSNFDSPIFVTGMARSGTSMVGGVIHKCGAWGGIMSGPTPYNKRGMFENTEIRDTMVKPCLEAIGVDPMGQDPLPGIDIFRGGDANRWRDSIVYIIKKQGYKEGTWFYKGAKMCLMWPLWHRAFPDAKWIIVRRLDKDVINSCLKTGFMRAFKNEEGWQGWIEKHKDRFGEMSRAGLDIREVWPQKIINGNFKEVKFVVEDVGLEWKEKEVIEFISPKLWNGGKDSEHDIEDIPGDDN